MDPTLVTMIAKAQAIIATVGLTCTNPDIRPVPFLFLGPARCETASVVCQPLHGAYFPPSEKGGRAIIYFNEGSLKNAFPPPQGIVLHEFIHCGRYEDAGKWGKTLPHRDAMEEMIVRAMTDNLLWRFEHLEMERDD